MIIEGYQMRFLGGKLREHEGTHLIPNKGTGSLKSSINPYLLHFGNILERHLWKQNSKIYFLISDDGINDRFFMTSHKSETTPGRPPSCHMTLITPEKPGT